MGRVDPRAYASTDDLAEGTGLARLNSRGRLQDHFRARILFPIADDRGDPISFGGRILPGGEGPGNQGKYKNTTETPLYNKTKVLYGLDRAKTHIVTAGHGGDLRGLHRRDRLPPRRGAAGRGHVRHGADRRPRHAAAPASPRGSWCWRSTPTAPARPRPSGSTAGSASTTSRWSWPTCPRGRIPRDLARSDPDRLEAAVEKATPFLRFRLDRAFAAADLGSNEGRARAAERALEIVAEHPDRARARPVPDGRGVALPGRARPPAHPLEEVRTRPRRPAGPVDGARRRGAASRNERGRRADEPPRPATSGPGPAVPAAPARSTTGPTTAMAGSGVVSDAGPRGARGRSASARARRDGPALEVLRHAVHDPGAVGRWLDAALFDDAVHRGAYQALLDADTHADALASSPPEVADLLARLLVAEPDSEPFDAVRLLHMEAARRHIAAVRLAGAQDADGTQALTDLATLTRHHGRPAQQPTAAESADRLLAWLGNGLETGVDRTCHRRSTHGAARSTAELTKRDRAGT